MCGIVGLINHNKLVNKEVIVAMRDALRHRGPDGEGLYFSKNGQVALGHRRLTLIDLSERGSQPMCNEDGTIWLTYNGEIYNFPELRVELENLGHRFSSEADSEVIIHGYEQWGTEILQRLKGMFAFGLWDEGTEKLLLARDRFGIKPLYYQQNDTCFSFGSELKAIVENPDVLRDVDYSAVADFLVYRYVPSPKTIWKGVSKLPPAHFLEYQLGEDPVAKQYWSIPNGSKTRSDKELIEAIDQLLLKSARGHILSDVPVGSFLSGGYDSSALVYYLNRIEHETQTFAIGFENWEQSEHQYAQQVADVFETDHKNLVIGAESLDEVEKLAAVYDEPLADISIVPTYLVSKMAAENVKAVVSGEGADELFCGYTWQKQYHQSFAELPWYKRFMAKFGIGIEEFAIEHYAEYMAMGLFDREQLLDVLHPDLHAYMNEDPFWFYRSHFKANRSAVKSIQHMDAKCFMGELVLVKIDRASMANSLEVRVPFLDHELFEFVMQLKESQYYRPEYKKFLLFKNIEKHLPENILARNKQGFVGPDAYYMDINWYRQNLVGGKLIEDKIIAEHALEKLLDNEDHWRLWKLVVLEFWFRRWT